MVAYSDGCAFSNGHSIYLKRTSLEIKRKHYSQLHDFMATMLLSTGILNDCCLCFFYWMSCGLDIFTRTSTLFHGGMEKSVHIKTCFVAFRADDSTWVAATRQISWLYLSHRIFMKLHLCLLSLKTVFCAFDDIKSYATKYTHNI